MSTYLLLRDNKESGPYSAEELVALGLKAYDLVWIKGKSAAWRYPSEVPELKPYAPAVEEQPFDRFYKKQEERKEESLPGRNIVKKEPPLPFTETRHDSYKPKPSVFVTLPNQQKITTQQPQAVRQAEEEVPKPTISVSENPAAAQIKYSQPLDEIKEMYVRTLQERRQKIAVRSLVMQSLKKASVILLLVAIGVIAGFMLKSESADSGQVQNAAINLPAKEESSPIVKDGDLMNEENQELHSGERAEMKEVGNTGLPQDQVSLNNVAKEKEPGTPGKQQEQLLVAVPQEDIKATYEHRGSEVDPKNGQRMKTLRNETDLPPLASVIAPDPSKQRVMDHPLAAFVSVKSNEYRKVAFGGIRDLQLTVSNDSKFLLDEVLVELQYLKPSELPLRTENISFKAISPNSSATIRIPDTNRGIRVVYRIIDIRSADAAL